MAIESKARQPERRSQPGRLPLNGERQEDGSDSGLLGVTPRTSGKGYAFVEFEILDPLGYKDQYLPRALKAVAKYDGRFLHSGKSAVAMTGDLTGRRVVVIEFPSFERALAFYDSAEYRDARIHRDAHATVHRYYLMPGDAPRG